MTYFIDNSDLRNLIVAKKLEQKNNRVLMLEDVKNLSAGDTVIFAPNKKFSAEYLYSLPNSITLICGALPSEQIEILQHKNITYTNLMKDEIFTIKNANLTAEGVLSVILENSPRSLYKNNVLILGGGRIALALAVIFNKLGVNFAITSYNKEKFPRYYLYTNTCYYKDSFLNHLAEYDVVVNTIPNKFINDENLTLFKPDCLFIETASVESLNKDKVTTFKYLKAPALPSKYSLETAGEYMYESILGENNYEN